MRKGEREIKMNSKKIIYTLLCLFGLLSIYGFNPTDSIKPTELIYASDHLYTPNAQPPRYWIVGQTRPPAPKGIHPEYAQGRPDGRLTGWGPWRGKLVLGFSCKNGLRNVKGKDLFIWHLGRKRPEVYVSLDRKSPKKWHLLGRLSDTKNSTSPIRQGFDFGDLDGIFYVKIVKGSFGFATGHFIDAVAGSKCIK